MTSWTLPGAAYGQPASWTVGAQTQPGMWSSGATGYGQPVVPSMPLATDELLKLFEEQAKDTVASLSATRRAATEVAERYGEVIDRLKAANDALDAELTTIHQQFLAEVSAATNSPLVDRCKRAYQSLLEAYAREVAAATSGTLASRTELESGTRRAADAYARAVADLNAELARQLAAAYERYLSGIVSAVMDADLPGLVAAGNEELLEVMVEAYKPVGEPQPGRRPAPPTPAAEERATDEADEWGAAATEAEDDPWASAQTPGWDEGDEDDWATATTGGFDDVEGGPPPGATDLGPSPWGPTEASDVGGFGTTEPDEDLSPWGSSGAFGWEDVEPEGSAGGIAQEAAAFGQATAGAGPEPDFDLSTGPTGGGDQGAGGDEAEAGEGAAAEEQPRKQAAKKATKKASSTRRRPRRSDQDGE